MKQLAFLTAALGVLAAIILALAPLTGIGLAAAAPTAKAPAARAAPRDATQLERQTKRLYDTEAKLRAEKDPAQRQLLADQVESIKHQMGPRDATGARVHPQAMWHDTAIDALDAEAKRLAARPKAGTASPAIDARTYTRRMAVTCLTRGWTWGGRANRYQLDAYGMYLANNMAVLDALFDSIAGPLAREAALPPGTPDREAFVAALKDVKDAVGRMGQAADRFTAEPKTAKEREAMIAALGEFTQGLQSVADADAVLRDLAENSPTHAWGSKPPATPGVSAAPAPTADASPTGPTSEEKARLEAIRPVAAELTKLDAWKKIGEAITKYAAVAEQGLGVERARPSATELLDVLGRTADYIQGLLKSKAAYPEYVELRRGRIEDDFTYLGEKGYRQYAYSRLRRVCEGDKDRLILDACPLGAEAAKGILRATTITAKSFPPGTAEADSTKVSTAATAVAGVLGKLPQWPPPDMTGELTPLYKQAADLFIPSAEAAGKTTATETMVEAYQTAAVFAKDIERLVRADQAIKAVAKYMPSRAGPMYADLVRSAQGFVGNITVSQMQERTRLDEFFPPFLQLADLRLPGPEHAAVVNTIAGGSYKAALTVFERQVTQGITDSARGLSTTLTSALEIQYPLNLLRHRAVAEVGGFAKAPLGNMEAFSVPDKTWNAFVAATDRQLRQILGQYPTDRRIKNPTALLFQLWDAVYCFVTAEQRLNQLARRAGTSDLDWLLRNLAQASDPSPPDAATFGWAVGFHSTEAAAALTGGFEETARGHRMMIREQQAELRTDRDFTAAVVDPKK